MRTVIGYNPDGSKRWSENVPSENPQWGGRIGGRAIEERTFARASEPTTVKNLQQKLRRLRGAALEPEK